jgi:hypothetical protein
MAASAPSPGSFVLDIISAIQIYLRCFAVSSGFCDVQGAASVLAHFECMRYGYGWASAMAVLVPLRSALGLAEGSVS